MKKLILGALALSALLPVVSANAQEIRKTATLAYAWDMDGEAADDNQVVEAAGGVIVDNGTSVAAANYTITAQPDTCRLLNLTISDTNMGVGAGTITVNGIGCLGGTKTCTWSAWTAADDDGVKTLTCTDGMDAYMKEVTSITTGVMTGESDEYFLLGYAGVNSVNGWPMYGRLTQLGPLGEQGVDPFGSYPINLPITTSAASSTTVTSVGSAGSFQNVAVGDLLLIPLGGKTYERKVTARASANSITVNQAMNIPTAGVTFAYKKFWFSTNPAQEMFIPVSGFDTLLVNWSVDANADTGGVVTLLQCTDSKQPDFPTTPWVQMSTFTTATGVAQAPMTESVDLTQLPYQFCRMGFRFGTGDDIDGADESLNASIVLYRK
jgi:hypothetical protein